MKTRDNIYKREGTVLLRLITTYHALRYDQVLQFFPRNHRSLRTFITTLIKQGRIYHDKEKNLLCDSPESAASPDYGMIAAFWLLLDFKKISFTTPVEIFRLNFIFSCKINLMKSFMLPRNRKL